MHSSSGRRARPGGAGMCEARWSHGMSYGAPWLCCCFKAALSMRISLQLLGETLPLLSSSALTEDYVFPLALVEFMFLFDMQANRQTDRQTFAC